MQNDDNCRKFRVDMAIQNCCFSLSFRSIFSKRLYLTVFIYIIYFSIYCDSGMSQIEVSWRDKKDQVFLLTAWIARKLKILMNPSNSPAMADMAILPSRRKSLMII